ncbi:MAG: Gfo/Idh/MocA family oxidoreductase [Balneolaceae bacterium]|nr:Gfo/Idh/MocA family oxidoreductase [Balneolaceae bacterium]
MGNNFRFVIVGSGNISQTYQKVVGKLDGMELAGIVSRSADKRDFNLDKSIEIAPSMDAVSTDFDAVILATPNHCHHEGAIQAAKLGKHVLTEKPLDITIKAMDRMIDNCRAHGVKHGSSLSAPHQPG